MLHIKINPTHSYEWDFFILLLFAETNHWALRQKVDIIYIFAHNSVEKHHSRIYYTAVASLA